VSAVGRADLKKYQGRTLDDIAKADQKDPLDVLMDLIAQDDTTGSGIMFFMNEDDLRAALKHPLVMLGTDSGGMAIDSGPPTAGVHPRAWGSAARILGKYVREERLLSLEEAIRKITSLPAQRMRLWDRGIVRPGAFADLVVFDPATIRDRATFENPRQYAEGVRYVAVNGQLVVDGGQLTDGCAGRALRGPGCEDDEADPVSDLQCPVSASYPLLFLAFPSSREYAAWYEANWRAFISIGSMCRAKATSSSTSSRATACTALSSPPSRSICAAASCTATPASVNLPLRFAASACARAPSASMRATASTTSRLTG
jgi:hypothetical protein